MLFSPFLSLKKAGAENEKTAIAGGFSGIVASDIVLLLVNLPLLHRRWAGMAKPKIKGKEGEAGHGVIYP
jgi:hypothetical protein